MSDSANGRAVPLWTFILCWLIVIPILVDTEYWWWMKAPLILLLAALTVVLARLASPGRLLDQGL